MNRRWLDTRVRGDVRALQRNGTQGAVYLIGARSGYNDDGSAPVKVGFSTDVETRLRQLQTASPDTLRVIAIIQGTPALEAHVHRRLAPCRIRGEWYALGHDDIACLLTDLYEDLAFGDFREAA